MQDLHGTSVAFSDLQTDAAGNFAGLKPCATNEHTRGAGLQPCDSAAERAAKGHGQVAALSDLDAIELQPPLHLA